MPDTSRDVRGSENDSFLLMRCSPCQGPLTYPTSRDELRRGDRSRVELGVGVRNGGGEGRGDAKGRAVICFVYTFM